VAKPTLSKLFQKELEDLTEIDDFSPPRTADIGGAEFTAGKVAGNSTLKAEYDIPKDMPKTKRTQLRKRVTRDMAQDIVSKFESNMSSQRGTTIEALALKLAGVTDLGNRRASRQNIAYALGDSGGDSTDPEGSSSTLVEMRDGSKRRTTTLQPLLREIMQRYATNDMTRPNAPLKFRTGRFVKSTDVTRISTVKVSGGRDTLSLFYTYMLQPYEVFDPAISSYRGLSSAGRNPQRIIGQALQNAAKDVISDRYNLNIRQE